MWAREPLWTWSSEVAVLWAVQVKEGCTALEVAKFLVRISPTVMLRIHACLLQITQESV